LDARLFAFAIGSKFEVLPQYHKHSLHDFCKQPQQPDFHFKISGFLAAVKLMDKSGYPDMQTLLLWPSVSLHVYDALRTSF